MIEVHSCAACGRPPEAASIERRVKSARQRSEFDACGPALGCLVLYQTEDGGEAWMHRRCAAKRFA